MARLNNHEKAVQAAMKAMESGGAKFPKWAKALKFLSPLLTANMLFEGLRKIPGIGDIMEKIDDLDAWVTKNTLGRIPVLKWNNALKKAGQNFLSGGDKSIKDYVYQKDDEDSKSKEEENDRSWYEPGYPVNVPTNESRPVDLNMVPLFTPDKSFLGGIAKLYKLCVSGYSIYKSKSVKNTIQTIFKSMRDNLKSNITYNINDVTCVLLNCISIYIMEKHLERRIGFTKFEDPEFKSFYDLWKKKSLIPQNYGIYELEDNPNLDVTNADYGISLDIYEKLVSMSDRCILPSHFKAWIDHYFGSVMVLDDDVANKKYIVVSADNVPFYDVVNGEIVETYISIDDQVLTPEYMYDFIDGYFHDSKVATIISDYTKAAEFGKIWNLSGFVTGWLTSMDVYKPVPIVDKGFKQALINAYTYDGTIDNYTPSYYRLDRISDVNDDLTTYLFLGKLFNRRRTSNIYGAKTWEAQRLEVLIFADRDTPVYFPNTLTQTPVIVDGPKYATKTNPFAIVVQSDISADVYVGANVHILNTQTRYYGPTATFPKLTPATTELTCNITADRNTVIDLPVSGLVPSISRDIYFYLPLVLTENDSGTPMLFFKRKKLNTTQLLEGVIISGSGEMGDVLYTIPGENAYQFLVDKQLMPCFSFSEYSGNASNYSFGAVGNIIIHNTTIYPSSIRVTFDWYSMSFGIQTESEAQQLWVQYSLYPNSDISTQYCLVTESVTEAEEPSINYGYVHLASTLFVMLGYSIPMYENLKVHVSVLNDTYIDAYVNQILLKEDYVPFYVNADDFPYIIDTMYDGLFNFKITSNIEVKDKQE